MSTTRQAYRPSYQDGRDYTDSPSTCTCGITFPNLGELFAHDCPDDLRHQLRPVPNVDTTPADSLDVPEWQGGAGGHTPRRPMSPKQEAWLRDLYAKAGHDADEIDEYIRSIVDGRAASREIDRMLAEAKAAAPAAAAQPCRPNRYAADCTACGGHVPAGAGSLCKGQDGRWLVSHADGQCIARDGHTAANPAPVADVAEGHYAIASTGSNDLAFYRVDRPSKGTYAGRVFVKLIVGGHPDRNVPRSHVAGILERIAADPDAARRYGREIGRCCRCNRHLTDETSRAAGIGPECAKL